MRKKRIRIKKLHLYTLSHQRWVVFFSPVTTVSPFPICLNAAAYSRSLWWPFKRTTICAHLIKHESFTVCVIITSYDSFKRVANIRVVGCHTIPVAWWCKWACSESTTWRSRDMLASSWNHHTSYSNPSPEADPVRRAFSLLSPHLWFIDTNNAVIFVYDDSCTVYNKIHVFKNPRNSACGYEKLTEKCVNYDEFVPTLLEVCIVIRLDKFAWFIASYIETFDECVRVLVVSALVLKQLKLTPLLKD